MMKMLVAFYSETFRFLGVQNGVMLCFYVAWMKVDHKIQASGAHSFISFIGSRGLDGLSL